MPSKAKDAQSVNYRLDLVTQHYYLGILISVTEINAVFSKLTYQMPAASIIHCIVQLTGSAYRAPQGAQPTAHLCSAYLSWQCLCIQHCANVM